MQKVTMIIGEPCVGKSTLMREFMAREGFVHHYRIPYIPFVLNKKFDKPGMPAVNAMILGNYIDSNHKYPGTDRMSMACQPRVLQFIGSYPNVNFLFEGDRLGNMSMIRALVGLKVDLEVIHVYRDPDDLARMRAEHRPDQSPAFWKSRQTKIRNIRHDAEGFVVHLRFVPRLYNLSVPQAGEQLLAALKERI